MTRKYTIASGTVFYNDCKSLERTLESLKDKVDYMICVDGRYKHYPPPDYATDAIDNEWWSFSNDGSNELVKSYDNTILITMPNAYEIEKRQEYINWCNTYYEAENKTIDYLLIVDSDEYVLEYDAEVFEKELNELPKTQMAQYNVFAVMLEVNSGNYEHIVHKLSGAGSAPQPSREKQFAHSPRLWYKPYEMEYNVTHYNFRNRHPSSSLHYMDTNPAVKIIPGMKLGHDHALRTTSHLQNRYIYQKWLVDFEQNKLKTYQHEKKLSPKIDEYDIIDHAS